MKIIKIILIMVFFTLHSNFVLAEDKPDCSKISNDTLVGNLKYVLCKKNSDKIDKDGNFKKGTFKFFKKN
jgi:hypothetical protein